MKRFILILIVINLVRCSTDELTEDPILGKWQFRITTTINDQFWYASIIFTFNNDGTGTAVFSEKEISEAEKSLEFYRTKLQNSPNIQSLRSVYAAGMTNDLQVLSMASKTDEFAFTVIDSPFFPETAAEPSRRLILMLGTIISVIVSFVITLLLYYLNKNLYLRYSKLKIF